MAQNELANIGKQWDKDIQPYLLGQSIGRQLIPKNMKLSGKGIGNTTVQSFGYKATADAITDYDIRNDMGSGVDIEGAKVIIPIQQDEIEIKRRQFEAMISDGMAVDSDMIAQMAVKVAQELDKTIIQGWKPDGSTYVVKGFYQVAGLSDAGSDIGTYKGAMTTVATGLQKFRAAKIYSQGYNLVLAPAQYNELLISESSTGIPEWEKVIKLLNVGAPGNPGRILASEDLAAGTGFMAPVSTPANSIYFDLIEAQQPTNDLRYKNGDEKYGDIMLRLVGAAAPRFKYMNASTGTTPVVCKFTGL